MIPITVDNRQLARRYMAFDRFVWLLQNKKLWMSAPAGLPLDPWEMRMTSTDLERMLAGRPETFSENALLDSASDWEQVWRRLIYVNCWTAVRTESHALWRLYCEGNRGIALQTTLGRLTDSLGDVPLYRVRYRAATDSPATATRLATEKRPMFAYEREVRAVFKVEREKRKEWPKPLGFGLSWDPEQCVQQVLVHPEADQSFYETVCSVIETYAPVLTKRVAWSQMRTQPPLASRFAATAI